MLTDAVVIGEVVEILVPTCPKLTLLGALLHPVLPLIEHGGFAPLTGLLALALVTLLNLEVALRASPAERRRPKDLQVYRAFGRVAAHILAFTQVLTSGAAQSFG